MDFSRYKGLFDHGLRLGLDRLRYRLKLDFWNKRKRPICWFKGHVPYDSSSWSYACTKCSRCTKTLFYKRGYSQP